jgi:hypothetical protein
VVNAVEDLYISNRQPQEAAQALIDLAQGANLGAGSCTCPAVLLEVPGSNEQLQTGSIKASFTLYATGSDRDAFWC